MSGRRPDPMTLLPPRRWTASAVVALGLLAAACADGRTQPGAAAPAAPPGIGRPRLVDVGAGKCIPCKAMAPILDQLRTEYSGRFDVQFVDVWVDPDAAEPYRIRLIPTQIFYAADGRELSRHEGFMSREEILDRWHAHGFAF